MAYTFDETFATGIPPGFWTAHGSSITATWNEAAQATDLVFPSAQGYIRPTDIPSEADFWFEYDVELISRTHSTWHFGFWLGVNGDGRGYRTAVEHASSGPFSTHSWASFGSSTSYGSFTANQPWLAAGARKVLRIEHRVIGTARLSRLLVDGATEGEHFHTGNYDIGHPGIFGYGCTLRIHSLRGACDSIYKDVVLGARSASPNVLIRGRNAEPPANSMSRGYARSVHRHNQDYSGRGRIAGTVKEKSLPTNVPVGRKVVLIDQSSHTVVQSTFSDPLTGAYTFDQLSLHPSYAVISYDHEGDYRAVIADSLTATQAADLTP